MVGFTLESVSIYDDCLFLWKTKFNYLYVYRPCSFRYSVCECGWWYTELCYSGYTHLYMHSLGVRSWWWKVLCWMMTESGCYPRYTYFVMSHTSTGLIFTLSFLGSGFGLRLSNGGGSMLGYLVREWRHGESQRLVTWVHEYNRGFLLSLASNNVLPSRYSLPLPPPPFLSPPPPPPFLPPLLPFSSCSIWHNWAVCSRIQGPGGGMGDPHTSRLREDIWADWRGKT